MREKIYNNLDTMVHEVLEGVALASHGVIQKIPDATVLYHNPGPGQVGVVVGGGSGHEPMFTHYVGPGMANACASGYLFAAPSPDIVLAATEKANAGKGVLHLRINYAGDVMNFDVAAELAQDMGIAVQSVNITDDIASAPKDAKTERRGVAGAVLVLKAVGAAANEIQDLEALAQFAEKANESVRSLGVAFGPGSLPGEDKPFFDLPPDEMEVGVGIHGERGVSRQKRVSADDLATLLVEKITHDLDLGKGEEVAVLVNDLGAATVQELAIVYRRVFHCLRDKKVNIHRAFMGSFCSAQDMAGLSLSIMRLDEPLKRYMDAPTQALGWPERRTS